MQHIAFHDVQSVYLNPTRHIDCENAPFFYRYIEVTDKGGNMFQLCLYSASVDALEINKPEGETK